MNETIAERIQRLGGTDILTEKDVPELRAATLRVLNYMRNGAWCDDEQIIAMSGQREGLRRMRELRDQGFAVERRREGDTRRFQYRLVVAKPATVPVADEVDLFPMPEGSVTQ